ncbi:hypothetical protein N5923_23570 [Erwiniaceae bacterium BAC15a-03b]|uniref:Uncharacterized protein n=1 Tax=Winslowiella arboricola TaxID=2978220 RepID=A0A9J6PZY9_9GAMM|nr:hypothetical protein [Winslowiella arboricola]MCU5775070.1 hypothetical protein [Winslowiella arboricola]MCU5780476.1 hypothetical protein [Winslowiella arboricola]
MKITEHKMRGIILGKALPGDIKVSEGIPAYLVRKFAELHQQVQALEAERDSATLQFDCMQDQINFHSEKVGNLVEAQRAEVGELSMQIRRLVHALKISNPDNSLLKSVPDYMKRKGYWKITDCLRAGEQP